MDGGRAQSGHGQHRDGLTQKTGHLLNGLQAVHAGHDMIDHHQFGHALGFLLHGLDSGDGRLARGAPDDLKAQEGEVPREDLKGRGVVIHGQGQAARIGNGLGLDGPGLFQTETGRESENAADSQLAMATDRSAHHLDQPL